MLKDSITIKSLRLLLALKGVIMAIEEPQYTLIEKNTMFEIREYTSYIVAQTEVTGDFDSMGSKAFRILFKYISGENLQCNNIKMTSPVMQENTQQDGVKIQMTAPVIQERDNNSSKSSIYSFVMPSTFTLDTLPIPVDNRILLKELPTKTVAVRVFSGFWRESNFKNNEDILLKELASVNFTTIGQTKFARYNSPFCLWFMRRNEIMIEVNKSTHVKSNK